MTINIKKWQIIVFSCVIVIIITLLATTLVYHHKYIQLKSAIEKVTDNKLSNKLADVTQNLQQLQQNLEDAQSANKVAETKINNLEENNAQIKEHIRISLRAMNKVTDANERGKLIAKNLIEIVSMLEQTESKNKKINKNNEKQ